LTKNDLLEIGYEFRSDNNERSFQNRFNDKLILMRKKFNIEEGVGDENKKF
jgi:hypothetical protein